MAIRHGVFSVSNPHMRRGFPREQHHALATGIRMRRVLGQEHFPADVVAGAAAGWPIGHDVFDARRYLWADTEH